MLAWLSRDHGLMKLRSEEVWLVSYILMLKFFVQKKVPEVKILCIHDFILVFPVDKALTSLENFLLKLSSTRK